MQCIIRVELHAATWQNYETLHAAMASAGCSRQITSDDNETYQLPTAEYYYSGSQDKGQVLTAAKSAAAKTNCKAGIVVAEAKGITWSGLEKVKQKAYS